MERLLRPQNDHASVRALTDAYASWSTAIWSAGFAAAFWPLECWAAGLRSLAQGADGSAPTIAAAIADVDATRSALLATRDELIETLTR